MKAKTLLLVSLFLTQATPAVPANTALINISPALSLSSREKAQHLVPVGTGKTGKGIPTPAPGFDGVPVAKSLTGDNARGENVTTAFDNNRSTGEHERQLSE